MATSVVNEIVVWNNTNATEVASATGTGMARITAGVVTAVQGEGFPLVSGNYWDQSCSCYLGGWGAGALTALRLYASLIYFPKDITATAFGTRVTTGVGSALGRIGFYNVGTDGLPGSLFAQGSTTIDMSTSGTDGALTGQSVAFKGGTWYYAAIASDSAVSIFGASGNENLHGYTSYTSVTKITDYWKTLGSLVLPDPFGTPTGNSTGTKRVCVLVP